MSVNSDYLVINKKLFDKYYNDTDDCIISIDPNTKKIYKTNLSAQIKFGYMEDEFNQLNISDLYANIEQIKEVENLVLKMLKKNKVIKAKKFSLQTKSKINFFAKIEIYPVLDNEGQLSFIHLNIQDITTKVELEYQQKYLKTVFETTKEFIVTTYGRNLDTANKAMYSFFGYEKIEEFKENHKCICDFFIEEEGYLSPEIDELNWVEYILSNPQKIHQAKIKKENQEHIFNVNVQKLNFDESERYIAVFIDITQLHRQYQKIKEKDNMLIYQSKQAVLGELISMIAHQWKQPLSAISIIASNVLVDAELNKVFTSENFSSYAQETMDQVGYLTETINDFRDFLKPDRKVDTIKLSELVVRLEKIIGKTLQNNSIVLKKLFNDIELETYANDCLQILLCILNNSKDAFSEKNLENKKIEIFSQVSSIDLKIIIQDNAGGVNDEVLSKMFDPYFTTKSSEKGTGIGLYMVKKIIKEQLLGYINVKNVNKGLQTTITLPLNMIK